jgi:selenocysteine-specific elongation factor
MLPLAAHPLAGRTRLRLHLGTREVMARVRLLDHDKLPAGASGYAQLILEEPAVALKREPFIVRFFSPQFTIGGGIILDAHPPLHRRNDRQVLEHLKRLEDYDPTEIVLSALAAIDKPPIRPIDLAKELAMTPTALEAISEDLISQKMIFLRGNLLLHRQNFSRLKEKIMASLDLFHAKEPLRPGMKKSALALQVKTAPSFFEAALEELTGEEQIAQQDDVIKRADFVIRLNPAEEKQAEKIMAILSASPFLTPPPKIMAQMSGLTVEETQRTLTALQGMGRIVRLEEEIYITAAALAEVEKNLEQLTQENGEFGVGEFRELLNTTRKYALPLLNYFDEKGITERIGEKRRLLQKKGRFESNRPQ